MRELNMTLGAVHPAALDAALRAALPGKAVGVSTYDLARPISIWLDDTATPDDEASAAALADAHDPVFLSADRQSITADGSDPANLTVTAPKPGAAPVTLLVAGTAVPVTLTDGVGVLSIVSTDPTTITVSVQNAANRSADQLTIEAV
jgi:hypothetical protein